MIGGIVSQTFQFEASNCVYHQVLCQDIFGASAVALLFVTQDSGKLNCKDINANLLRGRKKVKLVHQVTIPA